MNKKWQIKRLRKYLRSKGIEDDLIDLEAIVDSKLSYRENKRKINEIVSLLKNNSFSFTKVDKLQALLDSFMQKRKNRSVSMDLRKQAKRTFLLGELTYDKRKLKKYLKHPNRYDVEGIDTLQIFDIKKIEEELKKMTESSYDMWY